MDGVNGIVPCRYFSDVVHTTKLTNHRGYSVSHSRKFLLEPRLNVSIPSADAPVQGRSTFTYKFRATQYGHTWYHRQVQKYISYTILFLLTFMQHSHYALQYPDGVAGPLLPGAMSSLSVKKDFNII